MHGYVYYGQGRIFITIGKWQVWGAQIASFNDDSKLSPKPIPFRVGQASVLRKKADSAYIVMSLNTCVHNGRGFERYREARTQCEWYI